MARLLRIEFAGAIHHVTVRGIERRAMFRDDDDRGRFVQAMAERVEDCGVRLHLYCLMDNHVHLLVETPRGSLGRFIGRLLTAYTVYFNLRHRRAGHLTQGRYGARLVEGDEYLLRLSRYVHLNPVFTSATRGLPLRQRVRLLRSFPWSTYRGYVGGGPRVPWVTYEPLLAAVSAAGSRAAEGYRRYVEAGLAETDDAWLEMMRGSRLAIGSDAFRQDALGAYRERVAVARHREDVAFRRPAGCLPAGQILDAVAAAAGVPSAALRRRRRNAPERAVAAKLLCREGGLTQRAAAVLLGMGTGAALGRQLRRLEGALQASRRVRRLLSDAESALQSIPASPSPGTGTR